LAFFSYALHVVSSFIQVWLNYSYYYFSDMHSYIDTGEVLAWLMDRDLGRFGPGVLKLYMHLEPGLPFIVRGEGKSTGSMSAVSGAITYLTGPSVAAVCLVVGVFACLAQLAIYKMVREDHPPAERPALMWGLTLVPSVILWSSALAKEAVAVAFFGFLCAASHRLAKGRSVVLSLAFVSLCGVGIGMVKPYVLFPFVLAAAAWFYASRRTAGRPGVRPVYLGLAIILAALGLAAMGAAFPEFGTSKLGETTALQQDRGALAGGGSYTEMGDRDATSLSQQIPFVPLALMNALFRPFIFESRNGPMLAAALESTVLTIMMIALIWRFRWRRVRDEVLSSPTLAFCIVFVLTFAAAVGLATTNLGTLSRYRMPMMPFYATAVLLLRRRLAHRVSAAAHPEV
jgi:hypothetical protein